MNNIISIKFSADTQEALHKIQAIGEKISGLGSFISGLGAQIAAGFTIGAIVRFTEAQIQAADETGKLAQSAGIATEELSKLLYAAKLADVGTVDLGVGIRELNNKIATGSDLFDTLGIALKNEDGSLRSTSEIFGDIAEKFSGFSDGANKSALAVQLFGRSGSQMVPLLNGGKKAIADAATELEKFGGVVTEEAARNAEEFNDDLTRLKITVNGLFLSFAQNILPILKRFTEYLKEIREQASAVAGPVEVLTAIFKSLATAATLAATSFLNIGQAIGVAAAAELEVLKGNFKTALQMILEGGREMEARALRTKDAVLAIWASAKPGQTAAPEIKAPAPTPGVAAVDDTKINQSRLDSELKLQESFNAIAEVENENRLKWQLQSITEFYAKKLDMVQDAAAAEQKVLFEQIADAEKLMAASKDDPQKLAEATALRDQLRQESFILENKLTVAEKKLYADKVEASIAAEKEIADARILIAEQTGQTLLANELKIRQQFSELRQRLSNSDDPNRPTASAITAAEQTALAQARVADQIERQTQAQTNYQQSVQTTNALFESGQITQREAQERNNAAASEYLDLLNQELVALGKIAEANPGLDGLLEKIRAIKLEQENTKQPVGRDDFGGQISKQFDDTQEGIPTLAEDFGKFTASPFLSAIDPIREGISGLIEGTKTWGQALEGIGTGVLKGVVNAFSQMVADFIVKTAMMGIKWVATQLFMTAASETADAAKLTSHVVTETGMTVSTEVNSAARGDSAILEGLKELWKAAVKGASSVADIPYVGWALAIAAIGSIIAVGVGAMGGFKDGGYTGNGPSYQEAGIVHKDEFVMPSTHRAIFPILEKIRTGSLSAQTWANSVRVASPITSDPDVASKLPGIGGGSGNASPNVNVQGHSLKVGFIGVTEGDMKRYIEEEMPDKIMKVVRGMKTELGAT